MLHLGQDRVGQPGVEQELPGLHPRQQTLLGMAATEYFQPSGRKRESEGVRRSEEKKGVRRSQKESEGLRRGQEESGGVGRIQKEIEWTRRSQK